MSKPDIPAHMDDWEPGTIEPQCMSCRHWHSLASVRTCDAFPDGIPAAIILNEVIHDSEYPGDHGIIYHPANDQTQDAGDTGSEPA